MWCVSMIMPFSDVRADELRVSREQAIARAERLVLRRGLAWSRRLEVEITAWDKWWPPKEGDLEPRALAASRGPFGWTVIFRFRGRRAWGRAVTMDRYGRKIALEPAVVELVTFPPTRAIHAGWAPGSSSSSSSSWGAGSRWRWSAPTGS
jgi:hypothetical protein